MRDENKVNYSVRWTQPYSSGWRKRKIVEQTLNELHSIQLDMIDDAVEKSDMAQAKELINYIKNKA